GGPRLRRRGRAEVMASRAFALVAPLPSPGAEDDHGTMPRPLPAALLRLANACAAAAFKAPTPRIPIPQTGSNLHRTALGGERATNDRYHGSYPIYGIEVTSVQPDTGGWGWDGAIRWGSTSGEAGEQTRIHLTNTTTNQEVHETVHFPNERTSDI